MDTETNPFEQLDDVRLKLSSLYECFRQNQAIPECMPRIRELLIIIQAACKHDKNAVLGGIFLSGKNFPYCVRHSVNVAVLCELVGQRLGWLSGERKSVLAAALTMNVSMLDLQDKLYEEDWGKLPAKVMDKIHRHPEESVAMLRRSGVTDGRWLGTVITHHERADGSGYPKGLVSEKIPLSSRLLMLADIYAARVVGKRDQQGVPSDEAMRKLFLDHGKTVDKSLFSVFLGELGLYPAGTLVRLKDQRLGVVIEGKGTAAPRIQLLPEKEGNLDALDCVEEIPVEVLTSSALMDAFQPVEIWGYVEQEIIPEYLPDRPDKSTVTRLKKLLSTTEVPSIPDVLLAIQKEMRRPEPRLPEIARLVEEDMLLTALLLKIVNSPAYGTSIHINAVMHALSFLGLNRFYQLVLLSALKQTLSKNYKIPYFTKFWVESAAIGDCNRRVARILKMDEDLAYLAGLFQANGQLLMARNFANYVDKLSKKSMESPLSICRFEKYHYRMSHTEVGFMLADYWQLDSTVCSAIYLHHAEDYTQIQDPVVRTFSAMIAFSATLINQLMFVHEDYVGERKIYFDRAVEELGLDQEEIDDLQSDMSEILFLDTNDPEDVAV
jgi:HD-like signal output (HDOD) protein